MVYCFGSSELKQLMKNRIKKYKRIYFIGMVIIASIIAIILFSFVKIWYGYYKSEKLYKNIETEVLVKKDTPVIKDLIVDENVPDNSEEHEEAPFIYNEAALKNINQQGVGMLVMEAIGVTLPVVKGTDNEFYLKHAFDNTYSDGGCLFVDYRNASMDDRNIIIYGHNMRNGSMFGNLDRYLSEKFCKENPYIDLYIGDEIRKYIIFSVHISEPTDNNTYKVTIKNDKIYSDFLEDMKNKSQVNLIDTGSDSKQCITLSTCTGNGKQRVIVQALLY